MISDIFISDVIDILESYRRNRGGVFYIPTRDIFKKLINIAFFTSLKKEEGTSVDFSLIIVNSIDIQEFRASNDILQFDKNIPLQIDTLVKVAPAHDKVRSVLVVSVDEASYDLNIVGFMAIGNPCNKSIIQSLNDDSLVKAFPDNIIISAPEAGSLSFAVANIDVGRMIDGYFVLASPSSFSEISLGFHLKKSIASHELYNTYGKVYWDIYRATLVRLLAEASTRGHGSTIVLLDSLSVNEANDFYESRYKFTNMFNLSIFIQKALEDGISSKYCLDNDNKLVDNIAMLAQLATVDGALIMTNKLEFESFGATLSAPQWEGTIMTGPDGFGNNAGNSYSSKRLGTRHNSAIAFAGECKGSCVFVISHDGPIRAFLSHSDDYVICWSDCTL